MVTAAEWFDQFPLTEDASWDNQQWCPRHWAPCPLLNANGVGAATEVMRIFLNELATASTPDGLNREMAEIGPICCRLGDERMYEIWGHWPPTQGPEQPQ